MRWLVVCKDGDSISIVANNIVEAIILCGFDPVSIIAILASDY